MNALDADCVVVGAGCAGLSLAVALLEQRLPEKAKIILVDSRDSYTRDRNWCFFNAIRHPFEDAVAHRFASWRVRNQGKSIDRFAKGTAYCHVPSDRFYEIAQSKIAASRGRAELHLGVSVGQAEETANGAVLETSIGRLRTKFVFDSRAVKVAASPSHTHLLQHFVGHEIEVDRPVFDPTTATLMDFDVTQAHGIHFVYILPFSATRALVESTFFSPNLLETNIYEHAIRSYLEDRFGLENANIVDRERGVIPMSSQPIDAHPSPHVFRIGLAGGFAKPSTGYAFLASQRVAKLTAQQFANGTLASPVEVRPQRSAFLDAVFLSFLQRYPNLAPDIFFRLFERTPPEVLVRFMSETSSRLDDLRVMAALPKLAFMGETARSLPAWRSSF